MEDVLIQNSSLEGRGVFANRDFKKGEKILSWNIQEKFSEGEVKNLPHEKLKRLTVVEKGWYGLVSSPASYVNHSCNPNSATKNHTDIAIRDIGKGEEITSDYGTDTETTLVSFDCNCDEQNCRKKVT